jgi:predicted CXXCH cytochrome family protein
LKSRKGSNKELDMFKKLAGLMVIAGLFFASSAFAQNISGSKHDFSLTTFSDSQLCIVCHAPHGNTIGVSGAPLWNHELTVQTFTLYNSPTFGGIADISQPAGASKLCLSCHDGTVAVDNFGGATGGTTFVTGGKLVGDGGTLEGDHPISFTWVADSGLVDPTVAASGITGGTTVDADMLFASKVECASCHNVHDDTNGKFLLKVNDGSALCLTCHIK